MSAAAVCPNWISDQERVTLLDTNGCLLFPMHQKRHVKGVAWRPMQDTVLAKAPLSEVVVELQYDKSGISAVNKNISDRTKHRL